MTASSRAHTWGLSITLIPQAWACLVLPPSDSSSSYPPIRTAGSLPWKPKGMIEIQFTPWSRSFCSASADAGEP